MPCADVASSALSWTAEASVLGIRVLWEMAGVRGVRERKAIRPCGERGRALTICD